MSLVLATGCAGTGDYTPQIPVMPGLAQRMQLVARYRPQAPAASPPPGQRLPLTRTEDAAADESPAIETDDAGPEDEDGGVR